MSDYYCEEHRYNPPLNSVLRFCPYCLGAEDPAPEADSTSESSLKFQDGICHDCESPDLCIQDNGCHNTGKVFSQNDRPTCEAALSDQWKPIEKPEDVSDIHRPVVLWYPSHDAILCGAWDHSIEEWREWITDCPIVDNKPTHWMPLPAPPMSDK